MDVIIEHFGLFADAWWHTVQICMIALVASMVLGVAVTVLRVSPIPALQRIAKTWVTVLMNCPLAVVLFFLAFGLPEIGINGSYFWFGTVGLSIYSSAFISEALRSGINAVPMGQAEAARSIGLGFSQASRLVIFPQALRSSIPPLTNALIAMLKNSAIVGAFGVGHELFSLLSRLTSAQGIPALPVILGVIAGYFLLILPIGFFLNQVQQKVAVLR
jgi:glutamate transport system permease protein